MDRISVSVPSVLEIEAPLGGTSVEYKILVRTRMARYKTEQHKEDDVVEFNIQKAFRELEDFHDKLNKKFPNVGIPSIPKGRLRSSTSNEEKRVALNNFMKHISEDEKFYDCSIFHSFIGFDKKKHLASKEPSETHTPLDMNGSEVSDEGNLCKTSSHVSNSESSSNRSSKISQQSETNAEDPSKVFVKVKVRKPLDNPLIPKGISSDDLLFSDDRIINSVWDLEGPDDDLDLFEEAKQIKDVKKKEATNSTREAHNKLFEQDKTPASRKEDKKKPKDTLDAVNRETGENLKLKISLTKHKKETSDAFDVDLQTRSTEEDLDSTLFGISNDRFAQQSKDGKGSNERNSLGNITLFGEQDLGSAITREDELLFYIPENEERNVNANPYLSPTSDSVDDGPEVTDSLEELIQLPDPSTLLLKSEKAQVLPPEVEEKLMSDKPIPKPRRKLPSSTPLSSASNPNENRPLVAPRKVFLSKQPPPKPLPKPEIKAKPVVPPKPKPAKKPVVDDYNSRNNAPQTVEETQAQAVEEKLITDLNTMDIMQYIEQEEKAAVSGANLFD